MTQCWKEITYRWMERNIFTKKMKGVVLWSMECNHRCRDETTKKWTEIKSAFNKSIGVYFLLLYTVFWWKLNWHLWYWYLIISFTTRKTTKWSCMHTCSFICKCKIIKSTFDFFISSIGRLPKSPNGHHPLKMLLATWGICCFSFYKLSWTSAIVVNVSEYLAMFSQFVIIWSVVELEHIYFQDLKHCDNSQYKLCLNT